MEVRLSKFLFRYRVTPHTITGVSPAQLLMGRRLRTHLGLLHPDTSQKVIEKHHKLMKDKLPRKFEIGDKLLAKNFHGSAWIPVTVTKVTGPLSYHVENENGVVWKRHVDHLRRHYACSQQQTENDDSWTFTSPTSPPNNQEESGEAASPTVSVHPSVHVRYSQRTRCPIDRYSPSPQT